jgi:hypothetical protein
MEERRESERRGERDGAGKSEGNPEASVFAITACVGKGTVRGFGCRECGRVQRVSRSGRSARVSRNGNDLLYRTLSENTRKCLPLPLPREVRCDPEP